MKKAYLLSMILALGIVVVACTPQAQEQATDILTNETAGENMMDEMMDDSGTSMKVPAPGIDPDSVDEMMVEMMDDGENMMDEMMDDDNAVAAHVFNVGGVNFSFDVKAIRVKKGDTVTINFTSNGGLHDWVIDEFNARTQRVNSGSSSSITFVADQTGIFEYYCSVGNHRALGMIGKLIVE